MSRSKPFSLSMAFLSSAVACFMLGTELYAFSQPTHLNGDSNNNGRSLHSVVNIDPPEAADLPPIELNQLVSLLVPKQGFAGLGWDYMSESPEIKWQSDGYETSESAAIRYGLVRVRVNGQASTRLRKTREELAWNIQLITYGNPRFGPRSISIEPGYTNRPRR